ncbi:hypothetical protein A9977_10220 [Variovorax sp. UMC13]|jgi:hypothetical protein|nr:hypothetical protein [Variovorax sp. UMC13]
MAASQALSTKGLDVHKKLTCEPFAAVAGCPLTGSLRTNCGQRLPGNLQITPAGGGRVDDETRTHPRLDRTMS